MKQTKLLQWATLCIPVLLAQACGEIDFTVADPDFSKPAERVAFECWSELDDNTIIWQSADAIGVFCAENSMSNVTATPSASTSGTEAGQFFIDQKWSGDGQHTFFVYYPYNKENTSTVLSGTLNSAQLQNGQSTTHLKNGSLLYAKVRSTPTTDLMEANLNYVFSYVRFKLSSSKYSSYYVKSVTLKTPSNKGVAGNFTFDMNSDKFTVTQPENTVTLRLDGAPTLASPTSATMSLIPVELKGTRCEMEVDIVDDEAEDELLLSGTIDFAVAPEQSKIVDFPLSLDGMDATPVADNSVDLCTQGTANCYIASEAGTTYRFDATVMGNGYVTPATSAYTHPSGRGLAPGINPSVMAPQSAKILWQTEPGLISGVKLKKRTSEIYFTANGTSGGTLKGGNAVIAAYSGPDGTGTILWSWHIWVTDTDLAAKAMTLNNEKYKDYPAFYRPVVMDRNLGALTASAYTQAADNSVHGLYYQWGRKDPFPYQTSDKNTSVTHIPTFDKDGQQQRNDLSQVKKSAAFAAEENAWLLCEGPTLAAQATIENATAHPMTFIGGFSTKAGENNSWIYNADGMVINDLWGNPYAHPYTGDDPKDTSYDGGHKTIYDPCPPGWRVPDGFAFTIGFKDQNSTATNDKTNWNTPNTDMNAAYGFSFYTGGAMAGTTMFFPTVGCINRAGAYTTERTHSFGYYWCNNLWTDARARCFQFDVNQVYIDTKQLIRAAGLPVRCMRDDNKKN